MSLTKKEKLNVIMEARGYEYIPWNDERNSSGGAGYYVAKDKSGFPIIGGKLIGVEKNNPLVNWDFVMTNSIKLGCNIDSSKQDNLDKAFDKLYHFCYDQLNRVPDNQVEMFPKTCACGKNPSCKC